MSIRPVKRVIKSKPTLEGAGVHLRRAFGFGNTKETDPFLLLDDFRNDVPEDYLAGFPWHPHRGIETITYVLAGSVELRLIKPTWARFAFPGDAVLGGPAAAPDPEAAR